MFLVQDDINFDDLNTTVETSTIESPMPPASKKKAEPSGQKVRIKFRLLQLNRT